MDLRLLSRTYALLYASTVLIKNYTFACHWNMTAKRIAIELLGHAYLYALGKVITNPRFLTVSLLPIFGLKRITLFIATYNTLYKLGRFLIEHSEKIDVNNDEALWKMSIFTAIWIMAPFL